MRPTTARLRLAGTAGVISAFCNSCGCVQGGFEGAQLRQGVLRTQGRAARR